MLFVMPGLVPGIHKFGGATRKTWMAGTSPAMTKVTGFANNHPGFVTRRSVRLNRPPSGKRSEVPGRMRSIP